MMNPMNPLQDYQQESFHDDKQESFHNDHHESFHDGSTGIKSGWINMNQPMMYIDVSRNHHMMSNMNGLIN